MSSNRKPLTRQIIPKELLKINEDESKFQTNKTARQSVDILNKNMKIKPSKLQSSEVNFPKTHHSSSSGIRKQLASPRKVPDVNTFANKSGKPSKTTSEKDFRSQQKSSANSFTDLHHNIPISPHSTRKYKSNIFQEITVKSKIKNSNKVQQQKSSNHPSKPFTNNTHNVTIFSPPIKKKQLNTFRSEKDKIINLDSMQNSISERIYPPRFEENQQNHLESLDKKVNTQTVELTSDSFRQSPNVKNSIAYTVKFRNNKTSFKKNVHSRTNIIEKLPITEIKPKETEEDKYSDDFESYESDFESDSSTQSLKEASNDISSSSNKETTLSDPNSEENYQPIYEDDTEKLNINQTTKTDNEFETTELHMIPAQKYKDQKLDSGNYEENFGKQATAMEGGQYFNNPMDHIDCSLDTVAYSKYEQLDSGISTNSQIIKDNHFIEQQYEFEVFYSGYINFNTQPIRSQRGTDLIEKIRLDKLGFKLFEMKPISYESYMQIYGKLHTVQTSTQTHDNYVNMEIQTEDLEYRSIWTQHPSQYNGFVRPIICDENVADVNEKDSNEECKLESTLQTLKTIRCQNFRNLHQLDHLNNCQSVIDIERLNVFLKQSSVIMSSCESTYAHTFDVVTNRLSPFTDNSYFLEINFLNNLKIIRLFTNSNYNLIITVHEEDPAKSQFDQSNFCNLLMVWNITESKRPMYLLSTWAVISCATIFNDSPSIIIGAANDGTINLWDLRETRTTFQKLSNHLTFISPTLITIPIKDQIEKQQTSSIYSGAIGACVDIKNYSRSRKDNWNQFHISNPTHNFQVISLHDSGLLTIWTLLETSINYSKFILPKTERNPQAYATTGWKGFEYRSPWSRFKLIQSQIIDLSEELYKKHLHIQNRFTLLTNLFQRNICDNNTLQRLQSLLLYSGGNCNNMQGIRFHSLDVSFETIYISTNRNFILTCCKTLKSEHIRRIDLKDNPYSYPIAIKALPEEHFVVVGLSNGSVIIVNCNYRQYSNLVYFPQLCNDIADCCLARQHTQLNTSNTDVDTVIGKSCFIQNIIQNEKLPKNSPYINNTHIKEEQQSIKNANTIKKKSYELRLCDQQVILTGLPSVENIIQKFEISHDGSFLFILINKNIKIYDLRIGKEVHLQNSKSLKSPLINYIATARVHNKQQYLILQLENEQVEIHRLIV